MRWLHPNSLALGTPRLPNSLLSKSRLHPLTVLESRAMEEYIEEALQSGFIQPLASHITSGFFGRFPLRQPDQPAPRPHAVSGVTCECV